MNAFRFRVDAFVDVVEMAEFRLESRSHSLVICEMRLFSGELGRSLLRTVSVPFGSSDSLCGKLGCDELSSL